MLKPHYRVEFIHRFTNKKSDCDVETIDTPYQLVIGDDIIEIGKEGEEFFTCNYLVSLDKDEDIDRFYSLMAHDVIGVCLVDSFKSHRTVKYTDTFVRNYMIFNDNKKTVKLVNKLDSREVNISAMMSIASTISKDIKNRSTEIYTSDDGCIMIMYRMIGINGIYGSNIDIEIDKQRIEEIYGEANIK